MGAMNFVRSVLGLPDRAAQNALRAADISWAEETPWLVIARLEDSRSDFYPDAPLTFRDLSECVETFSPERRRVPVVSGRAGDNSGPSHWKGMYLPPQGEVIALDFDGLSLWGKFRAIVDPETGENRFEHGIRSGFTECSVYIVKGSNETSGKAMLWHVAQLSMGEGPGIPNMPSFDAWMAGGESDSARWAALSNSDQIQSEWRHFGSPSLKVQGIRSAPVDLVRDEPTEVAPAATEEIEMTAEEMRAMLAEAVQPLATSLADVGTRLAAVEARASEPAPVPVIAPEVTPPPTREDRALTYAATLAVDTAIQRGLLRPAVRAARLATLIAGGAEVVNLFAEQVEVGAQRSPTFMHEVQTSERETSRIDLLGPEFRTVGVDLQPDPRTGSLLARAKADPRVCDAAGNINYAALQRVAGELLASN